MMLEECTMSIDFKSTFKILTGNDPLSWQSRLFGQFCRNELPNFLDIPTGLGKTSIIHIWLIALAQQIANGTPTLPRRLVYVVDRRTVVDQATEIAKSIKNKLGQDPEILKIPLAVSTLRGQYADNREWAAAPSRPAIIIGTVNMIGSRLLFSGYGCSYRQRPIHAALLGHDSLVVLDEAHLSPAFSRLIEQIHSAQTGNAGGLQRPLIREPMPMRAIRMSATLDSSDDQASIFRLIESDRADPIVHRRINATKRLHIHLAEDVQSEITAQAKSLASYKQRVIVFVRTPEQVRKIADALRKTHPKSVEVLTGTMRGRERDAQLSDSANHPVFKRLLAAIDPDPTLDSCFLVATAAGEVGVDFNADHLVCDMTPIDSIIQRLGRVNRRGDGAAEIHLVAALKPLANPQSFDLSCAATLALLTSIPIGRDGTRDVSPLALRSLATNTEALSPKPKILPLTDMLLDVWAMTSIHIAMPGRPPVEPWLRGIDEKETPHTTVAWRIEVDKLGQNIEALRQSLDDYPLKPHELLNDRSDVIGKAIAAIPPDLYEKALLIIGTDIEQATLGDLAKLSKDRFIRLMRDKTLILPESIGGIEDGTFTGNWNRNGALTGPVDVANIPNIRHRDWVTTKFADSETPIGPTHIDDLDEYILRRSAELGMRYISSISRPQADTDDGPSEWFLYFAAILDDNRNWNKVRQSLDSHVDAVVAQVKSIASSLLLDADMRDALELAARHHDTGKSRELWQAYARRESGDPILGKSNRYLDPTLLAGFRHEFGSLIDACSNHEILSHTHRELILHLIAAHHGNARPHFHTPIDPGPPGETDPDAIAAAVPIRFGQLQRLYGRWGVAWLEAILRCADQRASAGAAPSDKEEKF